MNTANTTAWIAFALGSACAPLTFANEAAEPTAWVRGSNALGLDVLSELLEPGTNACVSPVSLGLALRMAAEGAVGETRAELLGALKLGPQASLEESRTFLERVAGKGEVSLKLANSLWSPQQ